MFLDGRVPTAFGHVSKVSGPLNPQLQRLTGGGQRIIVRSQQYRAVEFLVDREIRFQIPGLVALHHLRMWAARGRDFGLCDAFAGQLARRRLQCA